MKNKNKLLNFLISYRLHSHLKLWATMKAQFQVQNSLRSSSSSLFLSLSLPFILYFVSSCLIPVTFYFLFVFLQFHDFSFLLHSRYDFLVSTQKKLWLQWFSFCLLVFPLLIPGLQWFSFSFSCFSLWFLERKTDFSSSLFIFATMVLVWAITILSFPPIIPPSSLTL